MEELVAVQSRPHEEVVVGGERERGDDAEQHATTRAARFDDAAAPAAHPRREEHQPRDARVPTRSSPIAWSTCASSPSVSGSAIAALAKTTTSAAIDEREGQPARNRARESSGRAASLRLHGRRNIAARDACLQRLPLREDRSAGARVARWSAAARRAWKPGRPASRVALLAAGLADRTRRGRGDSRAPSIPASRWCSASRSRSATIPRWSTSCDPARATESTASAAPACATTRRRARSRRARFRIAAIGDSLTHGSGGPRESAYPEQLEALLNARAGTRNALRGAQLRRARLQHRTGRRAPARARPPLRARPHRLRLRAQRPAGIQHRGRGAAHAARRSRARRRRRCDVTPSADGSRTRVSTSSRGLWRTAARSLAALRAQMPNDPAYEAARSGDRTRYFRSIHTEGESAARLDAGPRRTRCAGARTSAARAGGDLPALRDAMRAKGPRRSRTSIGSSRGRLRSAASPCSTYCLSTPRATRAFGTEMKLDFMHPDALGHRVAATAIRTRNRSICATTAWWTWWCIATSCARRWRSFAGC